MFLACVRIDTALDESGRETETGFSPMNVAGYVSSISNMPRFPNSCIPPVSASPRMTFNPRTRFRYREGHS